MAVTETRLLKTKRIAVGQVTLCNGCCCGQTDRGFPAVPVARIKAIWKAEKLNKAVQLTISGCVGPCDVANVVVVTTADGTQWLGDIEDDAAYDELVDWARACSAAREPLPVPERLRPYLFERWAAEENPEARRIRSPGVSCRTADTPGGMEWAWTSCRSSQTRPCTGRLDQGMGD